MAVFGQQWHRKAWSKSSTYSKERSVHVIYISSQRNLQSVHRLVPLDVSKMLFKTRLSHSVENVRVSKWVQLSFSDSCTSKKSKSRDHQKPSWASKLHSSNFTFFTLVLDHRVFRLNIGLASWGFPSGPWGRHPGDTAVDQKCLKRQKWRERQLSQGGLGSMLETCLMLTWHNWAETDMERNNNSATLSFQSLGGSMWGVQHFVQPVTGGWTAAKARPQDDVYTPSPTSTPSKATEPSKVPEKIHIAKHPETSTHSWENVNKSSNIPPQSHDI